MTNNDILRRLRYTFNLNDDAMTKICTSEGMVIKREEVTAWLKKDEDEAHRPISDVDLSIFLDGFIALKRGKQEGANSSDHGPLTNNAVFRKLKIALNLKDDDIIKMLELGGMKVSKHEISAFFRKPGQKQYRHCKDQMLRNFIRGMQLTYKPGDKKEEE